MSTNSERCKHIMELKRAVSTDAHGQVVTLGSVNHDI